MVQEIQNTDEQDKKIMRIDEHHLECPHCKKVVPHNHWMCVDVVEHEHRKKLEENLEQQTKFNRIIALTGTILAFVGIVGLMYTILREIKDITQYLISWGVIILFMGLFVYLISKLLNKK